MLRLSPTLLIALLATASAVAADPNLQSQNNWPHWRGPLANGSAPNANPPLKWDDTTNIKWKTPVPGQGTSTPIVWNDQVLVLTAIKTDRVDPDKPKPEDQPKRRFDIVFPNHYHQFAIISYDKNTGIERWRLVVNEEVPHEGHHGDNDFASASPTTDGEFLYASFGSRGLFCCDLQGKLKWERDLGDQQTRLSFGSGSSPVIYGDTLIQNWDHDGQSYIFALDAATGETKWKAERDEVSAWATPLVVEHGGRTQVITNASNRVRSYDLESGDLIWECGGQVGNVTPSPVVRNGVVYCMSGYRGSAVYAVPLDSKGDITDSDQIVWKADRDTPYVPSPLLYGDLLYFNKSNNGILTCLSAETGETVFGPQRLGGISGMYASPVGAAGRVYILGRDGTTLVLRSGPQPEELAVNKLNDRFDASPALVGNQLFLRSDEFLYCIQEQ